MKNALVPLVTYGVLGALAGIVAGFILSFVIRGLLMLVVSDAPADMFRVVHMLGMGVGATVGGVFGAIVGLKK